MQKLESGKGNDAFGDYAVIEKNIPNTSYEPKDQNDFNVIRKVSQFPLASIPKGYLSLLCFERTILQITKEAVNV